MEGYKKSKMHRTSIFSIFNMIKGRTITSGTVGINTVDDIKGAHETLDTNGEVEILCTSIIHYTTKNSRPINHHQNNKLCFRSTLKGLPKQKGP